MGSRFDLSVVTHPAQAIKYTLDYLNLSVTSHEINPKNF